MILLSTNQFQPKKSHAPSQWKQRSACHEKEKLLESLPAPYMHVSGAKKNLYISTKKHEVSWFFPWKKNVVVLGRLDTLGVVVHDLRIRHTRRSSANLGHAVEGHVLLAVEPPAKRITVGTDSNKRNLMEPVINSLAKMSPYDSWQCAEFFLFDATFAAEQRFQVSTRLKSTPMSRSTSPGWTHCTPDHSPPQRRNGDTPCCYSSTESQNCTRSKWERLRPWRGTCWLKEVPSLSLSLSLPILEHLVDG